VSSRPRFFCKFRNWRVTAEKDAKTGTYVEHHRTKAMLSAAEFYCQPPRFFDDPHDSLQGARATGSHRDIDRFLMHNLDGVPEIMRKHKLSSITQLSQIKDEVDQVVMRRLARKHSRRETRVLSLSGQPGEELMWSFYGENHRGICLCFDPEHPFFARARPVEYVDDPDKTAEPTDDIPSNDPLLYTKGTVWAWQDEWRIVWPGEGPRCISFPRESLKAVVLGEWFQQAGFDDLIQTLVQGGYQAAICQMERLPGSFDYQIVPLGQIEPKKD
jgi:hypothetical protein